MEGVEVEVVEVLVVEVWTSGHPRRAVGEPRLLLELTLGGGVTRAQDIYDNRCHSNTFRPLTVILILLIFVCAKINK